MLSFFIVDAFTTEHSFSGNPAGICLLSSPMPDKWMQNVAAEMNHTVTAFLHQQADTFHIRYFTPTTELPLCGHATLASTYLLCHERICKPDTPIQFSAKGGELSAHCSTEGTVCINFPAASSSPGSIDPEALTALKLSPQDVYQSNQDIVCILPTEQDVRDYAPDFALIRSLPYRMFIITAASNQPGIDVVSRNFSPSSGIDEDPATGTAHCILGPLWAEKLGKPTLNTYQASQRGGAFKISIENDRVLLSAQARLILKGQLTPN